MILLRSTSIGEIHPVFQIADFENFVKDNLDEFFKANRFDSMKNLNIENYEVINEHLLAQIAILKEKISKSSSLVLKAKRELKEVEERHARFLKAFENSEERLKYLKEELKFSNKMIISNKKTIIAFAKLTLPESIITDQTNKESILDYKVYLQTIGYNGWKIKVILIETPHDSFLE